MAVLELLDSQKLVSRKIWMTEKYWNFHTVLYRDLPRLLAVTQYSEESAINVMLSLDETYADVTPSRLDQNSVTGFVSIQRGCDNMCSYCIVPFTRGRERSRPVQTILNEVKGKVLQKSKSLLWF